VAAALLTPALPPREGRRRKRERGLPIGNENSFTNNTKRNNAKYTKPTLSFLELGAASSCRAAPGSPGLDSTAGRNWTQECTDWNWDQDCRQGSEPGPFQKLAMDEESKTLMIPQL